MLDEGNEHGTEPCPRFCGQLTCKQILDQMQSLFTGFSKMMKITALFIGKQAFAFTSI
jgi:hypothetical protein